MKTTIQTKLILSFLSVIIVPIVVTAVSMWVMVEQIESQYDMEELDHLQYIFANVRDVIIEGYPDLIDHPEQFSFLLEETLEFYDVDIQIYAEDGKQLYDSRQRHDPYTQIESSHLPMENQSLFRKNATENSMTVRVDDHTNLKVIVHFSPTSLPAQIMVSFIQVIGLSLFFGFLSLIVVIGTFTRFISRSILKPLHELNRGTEQIAKGEFDFSINYHNDNEFGKLVKAFMLMKDKLRESINKQEEQEQQRKQLVANISHDIRTPIASIKGYVEGIQDGIVKNQEQLDKYLTVIHDKTDQLDRLVDDLYQYSKYEVGKMDILLQEYHCKDLFASLLAQFEVQYTHRDWQLTIHERYPEGYVKADKQRIMQVMENIIGNANRYIDEESGNINITIEQYKQRYIKISISDNGSGIAKTDLPYVFDQFYRGEKSRSREYGGTGLGLSISKYIIEAHGGSIWIESEIGQGTSVHFTLPLQR